MRTIGFVEEADCQPVRVLNVGYRQFECHEPNVAGLPFAERWIDILIRGVPNTVGSEGMHHQLVPASKWLQKLQPERQTAPADFRSKKLYAAGVICLDWLGRKGFIGALGCVQ